MAAGDIQSLIQNIGVGARMTLQPAVGSEFVVLAVGGDQLVGVAPNQVFDLNLELNNGVINSFILQSNLLWYLWEFLRVYITNTIYATIHNQAGVGQNVTILAMETK